MTVISINIKLFKDGTAIVFDRGTEKLCICREGDEIKIYPIDDRIT